jgi:hypothetical protein
MWRLFCLWFIIARASFVIAGLISLWLSDDLIVAPSSPVVQLAQEIFI